MPNYWFDHVHLMSNEPLKAAEFYEHHLGAKRKSLGKTRDGRTLISLSIGGVTLVISNPRAKPLAPAALPDGCGLEHFGLGTDNLAEAAADLKGKGATFVQEIAALNPTTRIAFFTTPDGTLIELVEKDGQAPPQP